MYIIVKDPGTGENKVIINPVSVRVHDWDDGAGPQCVVNMGRASQYVPLKDSDAGTALMSLITGRVLLNDLTNRDIVIDVRDYAREVKKHD
nr:MAG TPA: hypothetical protein [Bacteriophage sp.]